MPETLKKAIKVISNYALKNGQTYLFVLHKYESNHFDVDKVGKPKYYFEAYISGFSFVAVSDTIAGLIEKFEEYKLNKPPTVPGTENPADEELPF